MEYSIAIIRDYYGPKQTLSFVSDERQERIVYDSIADARDVIDEMDSETFTLDHNESNRPTYHIVDDNTADYMATGRNYDMSNYDWDKSTCTQGDDNSPCGECDDCLEYMLNADIEYIESNAVTQ